jgi:hypothetical protein
MPREWVVHESQSVRSNVVFEQAAALQILGGWASVEAFPIPGRGFPQIFPLRFA